jgi:peptidoglycan hydrolase-like protein with peptidoglycan-binding domain
VSQNEPATVPSIVHEVLRSPGQPLDRETREFMEPRFVHDFSKVKAQTVPQMAGLTIGSADDSYEQEANRIADSVMRIPPPQGTAHSHYDFSKVRVHSDSRAAESARAVNASAYTVGQDIVFGLGQYMPGTSEGRMLLAHELAHTAQQVNGMQRLMRKSFGCLDYAGDRKLEACLNDQDRLRPGDTGPSVAKVQKGLMRDGISVGPKKDDGIYGNATGQGVMAFKKKHNLGYTQYPDIGPGTMSKLDKLCTGDESPPQIKPPDGNEPERRPLSPEEEVSVRSSEILRQFYLTLAVSRINDLRSSVLFGGERVPCHNQEPTLKQTVFAMAKHLKVYPNCDSNNYDWMNNPNDLRLLDTISKATNKMIQNSQLQVSSYWVKSNCDEGEAAQAYHDDNQPSIRFCNVFFEPNFEECRPLVVTHEYFHHMGMVDSYPRSSIITPEQALNEPHEMGRVVLQIATGKDLSYC